MLDRQDVDPEEAVLRIRPTKFGKARLEAVHETTCRALAEYARQRDRVVPRPAIAAFFLATGGPVTGRAIRYHFVKVSRVLGLLPGGQRPLRPWSAVA